MTNKFALAAMVALFISCITPIAQAQELCAPDIGFKSAVGHDQAASSIATLNSAFKSASKKDFDGFMAIAATPYIQHSPDLADGWKPVWDLLADRPAGFSSERMTWLGPEGYLDNGEYLVMLREVDRGDGTPKSKIFDLLRFDQDGLYAEHWDMRQALFETTASGRSETAAEAVFLDAPVNYPVETEEANKRLVASFLNLAFNEAQLVSAIERYVSPDYVQHNPRIADGTQAIIDAFDAGKIPTGCYDIQFILAQNDLVFVYSKVTSDTDVSAVVDLFRVRDNILVEHWDVVQQVPADGEMPHGNGMF